MPKCVPVYSASILLLIISVKITHVSLWCWWSVSS